MELWIRSQDKRHLLLVKNISLAEYEVEGVWTLETDLDNGIDLELGVYNTKERALEVLDEIQSKLTSNKIVMQLDRNTHIREETIDLFNDKYNIKLLPAGAELKSVPNDIVIYEMPKEEED